MNNNHKCESCSNPAEWMWMKAGGDQYTDKSMLFQCSECNGFEIHQSYDRITTNDGWEVIRLVAVVG